MRSWFIIHYIQEVQRTESLKHWVLLPWTAPVRLTEQDNWASVFYHHHDGLVVYYIYRTPCQWFEGLYPWIIPARYTISFRVLSVRFKHSWTEIEVLSCPVSSTVSWALTAKTNAGSCFPSPDLNYRPLTPDGWFYHTSKTVYHTELSEPTAHSSLKELNIWYF